ncbi:MAG: DUF3298 domain-containing protein [Anaerolineae bacterium]|jgi:hypothetical protein|nr:DUF3298 and DUF4163 domain-containing protein [Chloroflexota bacterium]
MTSRMQNWKQEYDRTPIPQELRGRMLAVTEDHRPAPRGWRWAFATAATVFAMFVLMVNVAPAQAAELRDVPVLGSLVRVFTFVEYTSEVGDAHVRIPRVEGLNNQGLEEAVNAELLADGKAFLAKYEADVAELKQELGPEAMINMGVESFYEIKASNAEVFSLRVEYFWVGGGSASSYDFYNVNQVTGQMITLDSLFRPGADYLSVINAELLRQMNERNAEAGANIFWTDAQEEFTEPFTGITADHNFYINPDGKLVIAFDEYEVGPGSSGSPELVIPTELLTGLLAEGAPIH